MSNFWKIATNLTNFSSKLLVNFFALSLEFAVSYMSWPDQKKNPFSNPIQLVQIIFQKNNCQYFLSPSTRRHTNALIAACRPLTAFH